jgi:hypothetical protein
MEIVQTGTDTWPWCMGMFGARFAVFVRRARVLPSPCHAIRNLSFLRFHRPGLNSKSGTLHPIILIKEIYLLFIYALHLLCLFYLIVFLHVCVH